MSRYSNDLRSLHPDRQTTGFTLHWGVWAILIVAVLALVATAVGWGMGWIMQPARVTSVENVREQWATGYTNYNALKATAGNVCQAEKDVAAATTDSSREQRQSQLSAQVQNYNRLAGLYNAAMQDGFRARYVRPAELPETAPTLVAMKVLVCGP